MEFDKELIEINSKIRNESIIMSGHKNMTFVCVVGTVFLAVLTLFSSSILSQAMYIALCVLTLLCAGVSIYIGTSFFKSYRNIENLTKERELLEKLKQSETMNKEKVIKKVEIIPELSQNRQNIESAVLYEKKIEPIIEVTNKKETTNDIQSAQKGVETIKKSTSPKTKKATTSKK